jgi:Ca2+-binding RTX toxin-like protein
VFGTDDEDELWGSEEADLIKGFAGDDFLAGGAGDDCMYGSEGNDALHGGAGADELFGDEGNDKLRGQEGADTLFGGAGTDLLDGGQGDDLLNGGEGADTYLIEAQSDETDSIEGFNPQEDMLLLEGDALGDDLADFDAMTFLTDNATPDGLDLHIDLGNGHQVTLLNVFENTEDYTYKLEEIAGAIRPLNAPEQSGGDAADKVMAGDAAAVLSGGEGEDTLLGGANEDTLMGEAGDDYLNGGLASDELHGGDGGDGLFGEGGDDTLLGGAGNDALYGGAGMNVLTGGEGMDVFVNQAEGQDVVTDFDLETDSLWLQGLMERGAETEAARMLLGDHATVDGANVMIDLGDGRSIQLVDIVEDGQEDEAVLDALAEAFA